MLGSQEQWVQCECGLVHKADLKKCNIIDDIYVELWCSRCHKISHQLLCGDKAEDIYILYDSSKDVRFYQYNTTK